MERNIVEAIQNITLGGGIALAAYFMRPLWVSIGRWLEARGGLKGSPSESYAGRLASLEKFQTEAEGNHFTDLERLMEDVRELQGESRETRKEVGNIRERLVRIETKMNGSLHT